MDPITGACIEYMEHIRKGGKRTTLKENTQVRDRQRKLHPSSLMLCDRKAAYRVMADVGEMKPDIPSDPTEQLGHHVGYIFQDYVAEALAWKGALIDVEIPVENEQWTGRIDLLVDPSMLDIFEDEFEANPLFLREDDNGFPYWLVDVKTVKGYGLYNRYPKEWSMGQVEKYLSLLQSYASPVLYYCTRVDFTSALYTWEIDPPGAVVYEWGETGPVKELPSFEHDLADSEAAQEHWLRTGELPDRIAEDPTKHPFMCASYQKGGRYKGLYRANCEFFGQCWDKELSEHRCFAKEEVVDEWPF